MSVRDEIKSYMDKSMAKFDKVVNYIKPEHFDVQIQDKEGGWTVIELLRHIQNSERGMTATIQAILEGGEGASSDFDLKRYNTRSLEKMQEMSLDEIKANMKKNRDKTLEVLNSISDEQWKVTGRHASLHIFSIKEYFEVISWHQQHHLKGIIEKFNL